MKVAASANREKYDTATARTADRPSRRRQGTTVPIASVLTSAHSPPTSGTSAPSTLTCCTAGPAGGSGGSCRSRAASRSSQATCAAPACSVSRRAVAGPTCTRVKSASVCAARRNGSQVPNRTSRSCNVGVKPPGSSRNSSSRGEKPGPTGGTAGVAAGQGDGLLPVRA
jgi:hypothetical protein